MADLKEFRVIIAGGREFNDYKLLEEKADFYLSKKREEGYRVIVVSGTAKGADLLGERYAKVRNYLVRRFPADWNKYGLRAGYLRNKQMAENADALIAFWDGKSKGTNHMINLAKQHHLQVAVVRY